MNIVRCPQCKSLLHSNTKCYHCGNEYDFETVASPDVHEYAYDAFGKMDEQFSVDGIHPDLRGKMLIGEIINQSKNLFKN